MNRKFRPIGDLESKATNRKHVALLTGILFGLGVLLAFAVFGCSNAPKSVASLPPEPVPFPAPMPVPAPAPWPSPVVERVSPPSVPYENAPDPVVEGGVAENVSTAPDRIIIRRLSGKRNIRLPESETANETQRHDYKVELGADPVITIPGSPGRLRVWIGDPSYKANLPEKMVRATGNLPAVGDSAMVTPIAPAFKVEPAESICVKIYPSGSDVDFILTPQRKDAGTFDVGANVKLYESSDCSGAPVPKATTTLQVQVVVAREKEFIEEFWGWLLKFWKELLALASGVILILVRKQLKKLLGIGKDD